MRAFDFCRHAAGNAAQGFWRHTNTWVNVARKPGVLALLLFATPIVDAQTRIDRKTLHSRINSAHLKASSDSSELIQVTPLIEVLVDYGSEDQVCVISIRRREAPVGERDNTFQKVMGDFDRGKHLADMDQLAGIGGATYSYYEHIVIVKPFPAAQKEGGNSDIAVYFRSKFCKTKVAEGIF